MGAWCCIGFALSSDDARSCRRTPQFHGDLKRGQPLCWQHERYVVNQLQCYYLGVAVTSPPAGIAPQAEDDCCTAFIDDEGTRCGRPALHYYERHGQVDTQPLCEQHTESLIRAFKEEWTRRGAPSRWGWRVAEEYGLSAAHMRRHATYRRNRLALEASDIAPGSTLRDRSTTSAPNGSSTGSRQPTGASGSASREADRATTAAILPELRAEISEALELRAAEFYASLNGLSPDEGWGSDAAHDLGADAYASHVITRAQATDVLHTAYEDVALTIGSTDYDETTPALEAVAAQWLRVADGFEPARVDALQLRMYAGLLQRMLDDPEAYDEDEATDMIELEAYRWAFENLAVEFHKAHKGKKVSEWWDERGARAVLVYERLKSLQKLGVAS